MRRMVKPGDKVFVLHIHGQAQDEREMHDKLKVYNNAIEQSQVRIVKGSARTASPAPWPPAGMTRRIALGLSRPARAPRWTAASRRWRAAAASTRAR